MDLTALQPIIDEIVKESLEEKVYLYGKSGKKGNRVASGNLKRGISSQVTTNSEGIAIIQFTAFGKLMTDTYAYWLIEDRQPGPSVGSQKGRKKTKNYKPGPFVKGIMDWIYNKKSFKIRDLKTGKFKEKNAKNVKSAAWVIARSIAKNGYQNKPENFITVSIKKIQNDQRVIDIIGDSAFEDLLNQIEGL